MSHEYRNSRRHIYPYSILPPLLEQKEEKHDMIGEELCVECKRRQKSQRLVFLFVSEIYVFSVSLDLGKNKSPHPSGIRVN